MSARSRNNRGETMARWTFADIPDQTGRTAIVTGANAGIGLETARMLALKGASVVLACRNLEKGGAAVESVRSAQPRGSATLAALDLSDLDSVAAFAATFAASHERLDLLVANAGVMVPPFGRTKQGFELQLGTNHLGHFALVGHLLPLVLRTAGSRIVVVTSSAQNFGRIDRDDLNWERRPYRPWAAYSQSKLANQLFALELHRRLAAAGSRVRVMTAHPGFTATDLQRTSPAARLFSPIFGMKPVDGALPTLRAATDPAAASGSYWGPNGLFGLRGPPTLARISAGAQDPSIAAWLWDESVKLTGVAFGLAPDAA
jgi:NAD(P)-dependent dehydrogenase (short-subunit alcohol dehydrogenase family)